MSFIWPWVLLSLLALPACVYVYARLQRKRSRDAASLGAMGVTGEDAPALAGRRRHVAPVVFLIAVALLAVATARPQLTLPVPRQEGTVMLALDVSSSMAADDVDPTRIDVARLAARTLIERRPDHARVGVVAFGESGLVVQPPTDDGAALDATIDRLEPQSATSLGRGMLTALNTVAPESGPGPETPGQSDGTASRSAFAPAVIVLLTDGENTTRPTPWRSRRWPPTGGCASTPLDSGPRRVRP